MPGRVEQPVEDAAQAETVRQPGDDAFLSENQLPGVDAHQIARPEREHDGEVEQPLDAVGGVARHVICQRKSDQRAGDGDGCRHANRPQHDVDVRLNEQLLIGARRETADDRAGKVVEVEKALHQQRRKRAKIDNADPEDGRQEQEDQRDDRVTIERRPDAAQERRLIGYWGEAGGRRHYAPCPIRRLKSRRQRSLTRLPFAASTSIEVVSRFCWTTVKSPPPISSSMR